VCKRIKESLAWDKWMAEQEENWRD
jgi:hypothetical protein